MDEQQLSKGVVSRLLTLMFRPVSVCWNGRIPHFVDDYARNVKTHFIKHKNKYISSSRMKHLKAHIRLEYRETKFFDIRRQ